MTQYCGIIITETDLYVSVVKRIQNKIKVLDRYICKRGQSLIEDLAVIHSKNKHTPTLYSLAYTEIPHLIFNKVSSKTPYKMHGSKETSLHQHKIIDIRTNLYYPL